MTPTQPPADEARFTATSKRPADQVEYAKRALKAMGNYDRTKVVGGPRVPSDFSCPVCADDAYSCADVGDRCPITNGDAVANAKLTPQEEIIVAAALEVQRANDRATTAETALAEAREEIERLREALEFYAQAGRWQNDIAPDPAGTEVPYSAEIFSDCGAVARAALTPKPTPQEQSNG